MDKIAKKALRKKLYPSMIATLIGVFLIVIGMFLPYITATGELAEYIEEHPDRIEISEFDLTASNIRTVSIASIRKLAFGIYNRAEGTFVAVTVLVFCLFWVLSALFAILKKPIPIMVFDLLTLGVFAILNYIAKYDFIGPDKYEWGYARYVIVSAFIVIFATAIWMLVKKSIEKKKLKSAASAQITQQVIPTYPTY